LDGKGKFTVVKNASTGEEPVLNLARSGKSALLSRLHDQAKRTFGGSQGPTSTDSALMIGV
jgi:hypothetical protein